MLSITNNATKTCTVMFIILSIQYLLKHEQFDHGVMFSYFLTLTVATERYL